MERSINNYLEVIHHFSYYPAMEGMPLIAPISGPTVHQEDGQVRKEQKIGQSFQAYSYHPRPVEWEAKDIFATQEILKIITSSRMSTLPLEQSYIWNSHSSSGLTSPSRDLNVMWM